MRVPTCFALLLFASLLGAAPIARAAGAGFAEVPEPDELELIYAHSRPSPVYSLAVGPHLSLPRGDTSLFALPSPGISGYAMRWLSPRFALVARLRWAAISRRPIIPDDVAISTYALVLGARASSGREGRAGLFAEALFGRHTLRVERSGSVRSHHGAAMILGGGAYVRLCRDLRLEARASTTRTDSSMSELRVLRLRITTIGVSVAYDL